MTVCRNCGVEIEEDLELCPLCRAPLRGGVAEQEHDTPPPRTGRPAEGMPIRLARRRLWEIVSLFAAAAAVVVLVADFANGLSVTWARYPLLSVFYLWSAGSVLIFLRRRRLFLLLAETVAAAMFLLGLDVLLPGEPWFVTLALPLTLLSGALVGGVTALSRALRRRVLAVVAAGLGTAGLFVVGLEAVLNLHFAGSLRLSWSLVVFGCIMPLVGLLFYVQYRLKVTHSDMRKIFHL